MSLEATKNEYAKLLDRAQGTCRTCRYLGGRVENSIGECWRTKEIVAVNIDKGCLKWELDGR